MCAVREIAWTGEAQGGRLMAERRLTPNWRASLLGWRLASGGLLEHLRPAPSNATVPLVVLGAASQRRALSWRIIVAQATALWFVTRIAYVVLTYFAVLLTRHTPLNGYAAVSPHALVDAWRQWDTIWYVNIAHLGYWKLQALAYFPLYPMLIRLATLVIGPHWMAAALIVANLGTLAAFIGIALWIAQEDSSRGAGMRTIRALAAYPLALFLFAGYSEGIFIALVAFTFFFARRGSWLWAAICAFLAGLTRLTAVALALPLLWEYGRQHGWWERTRWEWARLRQNLRAEARGIGLGALAAGAAPAGFVLFDFYLWTRFHQKNPIPRIEHMFWHHTNMLPPQAIAAVTQQFFQTPFWTYWKAHQLLDIVPVAAFAIIIAVSARKLPVTYTIYTAAILLLAIISPITKGYPDLLMSAGRYMLAALPVFLVLGRWMGHHSWLDLLLTSGGFMLQGVLVAVLLNGGWLI
jgi:hypothetical protein